MEQLGFLNNILGKIQTKSSTVAINVSSKSTVEILELDKNGIINNYMELPIQYNAFTKEIENIYDFQSQIKEAFNQMKLSLSSKVYISIPTYVIEHEDLPKVDDEEAIKTMLTSSAEKNYIFKKYDPAISYFEIKNHGTEVVNNLSLCYTALRADEYTKMKTAFEELGLKVLAIDSSYSSLINGVIAAKKVNPSLLEQNGRWNIINITSNSYMIYEMEGKILISVYEEPLAVKSFTQEEIYQVITNSLDVIMGNYTPQQIIFVSQSDNVSAEYLSGVVNTNAAVDYIEDNKYRRQLIEMSLNVTQSLATKVSLEAIGISTWSNNIDGFKFNFLDVPIENVNVVDSITVNIGGKDVELSTERLQRWAISIGLFVGVVAAVAYAALYTLYNGTNNTKMKVAEDIGKLKQELNVQEVQNGISEVDFLQKNYTNNVNYKKSYAAVAREIPDMLWLEEFQLKEDASLYLHGRSYRMEDILNYYDSLNKLGKFKNLKISTLKISNTPISDLLLNPSSDMREETTYEFEFGETVYVDPTVKVETDKKDAASDAVPPPPPSADNTNNTSSTDIPPAPTNLPKQDN